jgi:hypothetical protein
MLNYMCRNIEFYTALEATLAACEQLAQRLGVGLVVRESLKTAACKRSRGNSKSKSP